VETGFKNFLAQNEQNDIENQQNQFEVWNTNRERKIDNQVGFVIFFVIANFVNKILI